MPQIDPYLFFDSNCAEAMRFYERTLGGKIDMMMTHAESPMGAEAAAGDRDRILHASLSLDGRYLMASDAMSGERYEGMKNFRVSLVYPKVAEARRVFDALAKGGQIDRFGTPWMVSGGEQAKP